MEYLRCKLRGKTPSWGRDSCDYMSSLGEEERGSERFSLWGRRESGGSISSLFGRNSKTKPDKPNKWSTSDNNSSSGYLRTKSTNTDTYSKPYWPTPSSSRYSSKISHENKMTSPRINRSSNLEDRILIRNNYNYYSRSPYLERRKQENYVITNEKIDYKTLFEREKQEREMYEKKLEDMEQQQKVLENNLKKFLDLKKEFSYLQHQAEESDRVVNDFIKAVVPSFSTLSRQKKASEFSDAQETLEDFSSFQDDSSEGISLPMPNVQYEWDDAFTSPAAPVGRYSCSTITRGSSRLDELKLNLVFDVNSKQLPTKLHLEIKDKNGRVVFKKRQNLYYVKVQERVSTLDAADDYVMTVTTICGPSKTSEDVTIHNKYYVAQDETEPVSMTESCTIPMLESVDMCRSPSEVSVTSGFDERSIDSIFDTPIRQIEATYDEVCREISETPLPDLEEIVEVDFAPALVNTELVPPLIKNPVEPEVVVVEKKNPFHLVKKPIVPEVVYKWQRGFRRDNSGRYCKVTILKIQFKYEESQKLLPSSLIVTNQSCKGAEEREKTVIVSDNSAVVEFLIEDISEDTSTTNFTVSSVEKQGDIHLTAPGFSISAQSLREVTLGDWHLANPVIILQL